MKHTHKHYLARLLVGAFLIVGIGFWMTRFVVDASTRSLDGTTSWNNANFLSQTFWDHSTNSGDVVKALFGSGDENTAYTLGRSGYTSGTCPNMAVEYLTGGDTIPLELSGNTIYVLGSGDYITTGAIAFSGNCIGLVGSGDVYLYSDSQIPTNSGLLYISGQQHIIIDNINFDGQSDGTTSYHTENYAGLYLTYSNYVSLHGIRSFNNNYGILLSNAMYTTINNSSFFNNVDQGAYLAGNGVRFNIFNNVSLFNNGVGIHIKGGSQNIFNNLYVYNSSSIGIYISHNGTGNIFHNILSANNATYGVDVNTTDNIFYGTLQLKANQGGDLHGSNGNDQYLTSGDNSYYTTLGWLSGSLMTGGSFPIAYIINPIKTNSHYLLDLSLSTSLSGAQVWTVGIGAQSPIQNKYSFGSFVQFQNQPVFYSGSTLVTGGSYVSQNFIGSDISFTSGSLSIVSATPFLASGYTNTTGITLLLTGNGSSVSYRIFGDVVAEKNGTLSSPLTTGITLTGSDGVKYVFAEIWTTGNRATRYQDGHTLILDTTAPAFTGTLLGSTGTIISGGYYNTGIVLTFSDIYQLSGAILSGLNGNSYINTGFASGDTISSTGTYIFTVYDLAGNSTGAIFTIDQTNPTLSGVISGAYYTGVTILGADNAAFSGFNLSGTIYTGTSLTVTGEGIRILTGYDKAGNTTGLTFTIDKTTPVFTGTLSGGTSTITSGGYYNTSGVTFTFADTNLSGAILSGIGNSTLYTGFLNGSGITSTGTYIFRVYDKAGNFTGAIFTIDTTNPIVTGNYPTSGLNISGGNNITFLRSGSDTNMSGYTLYVSGTSYTTSNTSYTINNMSNGNYTWYVVATDRAGNTGASTSMPFSITTPLSGFVVITGTNTKYGLSHPTRPYTKDYISLSLQPNQPCNYQITGDIVTGVIDTTTGAIIVNVYLSGVDGAKYIYVTLSNNSGDIVSKTILAALDTTKPSDATLHTPTSGAITSGAIGLSRYAASDTGVGLSGYQWIIASDELFTDILRSGFTSSTTATVPAGVLGNMGTFYWKVRSLDRLGLTGQSTYRNFYYSGSDYTPDDFTFDTVTNARLNKIYLSSKETIEGLSTGTHALVEISRGSLYINGDDVGGQTGLVENGDTVQIELISSDEYETRVSSTITIGEFSTYFRVTTKADTTNTDDTDIGDIDTNLSTTEKLQIVSVFMALKDMYSDSTTRTTFFTTLMNSLQDQIDSLDEQDDADKIDALQYLYDVVDNYLGGTTNTDDTFVGNSDRYVAPNGKVYQVTYNTTAKTYTSPNFIFKKTFTTLAAMKAYIDVNNGGGVGVSGGTFSAAAGRSHTVDTTWQSAPYQAPNGKTYRLFRTTDGRYSSYDFSSAKYFISVDALKNHIYQWNK